MAWSFMYGGELDTVIAGSPLVTVEVGQAAYEAALRKRGRRLGLLAREVAEDGRLATTGIRHAAAAARAAERIKAAVEALIEAADGRLKVVWVRRPGFPGRLGWGTADGRPARVRLV